MLAALASLASLALLLRWWKPRWRSAWRRDADGARRRDACAWPIARRVGRALRYLRDPRRGRPDRPGRQLRGSRRPPPSNVTAVLRCGQPGNARAPSRGWGPPRPRIARRSGSRCGNSSGRGRHVMREGRPVPLVRASRRSCRAPTPYPLTLPARLPRPRPARWCSLPAVVAFVPMLARRAGSARSARPSRAPLRAAAAADRDDRVHPVDRHA